MSNYLGIKMICVKESTKPNSFPVHGGSPLRPRMDKWVWAADGYVITIELV